MEDQKEEIKDDSFFKSENAKRIKHPHEIRNKKTRKPQKKKNQNRESFPKGFRLSQVAPRIRKKKTFIDDESLIEQKKLAQELLYETEQPGFIEPEDDESTIDVSQKEIKSSVDIQSAHKIFDLNLPEFGPYMIDYTRDGNFIALAGNKGHFAIFNWKSMKLTAEVYLKETIRDVVFLHSNNRTALAQKKYVYIYNEHGSEVHRLKDHQNVNKMKYLVYHWLLVTLSKDARLQYLDVTTGSKVSNISVQAKDVLNFNSQNGIVFLGNPNGTVSLYSPNVRESIVSIFCHNTKISHIGFNNIGNEMITSDISGKIKIWDLRKYEPIQVSQLPKRSKGFFDISQTNMLAANVDHSEVWTWKSYKDLPDENSTLQEHEKSAYLRHFIPHHCHTFAGIKFCPFEDYLGLGYIGGFSSIAIPGSGQANIDSLENNPFFSKKIKNNFEVRSLIEKIPYDMISLTNTGDIGEFADTKYLKIEKKMKDQEDEIEQLKGRNSKLNKKSKLKEREREALKNEVRIKRRAVEKGLEKTKEEMEKFFSSESEDENEEDEKLDTIDQILKRFK